MKTKTLIILFALVMALSVSAGVFAEGAWDQTWDEETVLTVFSGVDMVFPDLFADEDSDYLWVDNSLTESDSYPDKFPGNPFYAKAPIASATAKGDFTFDPCGDGLIKFTLTLDKEAWTGETAPTFADKYGPEKESFIRDITATYEGVDLLVKKCNTKGEDNCNVVTFNKKGQAEITGYLYYPGVLDETASGNVEMTITFSNYFTALWDVDVDTVTASGPVKASKNVYCQPSLEETDMAGVYTIRAKYDPHTGEARFQAVIRNFAQESNKEGKYNAKQNYVIPADVLVPYITVTESESTATVTTTDDAATGTAGDDSSEETLNFERYTDYTCKYTVYNNGNAAPRTDYCKFGEGIALAKNAIIRFDITIDHLSGNILRTYGEEADIPFNFRVGGLTYLVGNYEGEATKDYVDYDAETTLDGEEIAAFAPVDYPCPIISRMEVMDPLKPFMTFFKMISDDPIEPSGAYGVYDGGLWGMYQKCGKYAYMAVRLMNDGIQTEEVNLNNVAVAINGGTPMKWNWVMSTIEPYKDIIELEPGEDVILIGRAKVTDYVYQMNSDQAITGAVNFLDYGFYIQGKVYSDHNNTNCTVAP